MDVREVKACLPHILQPVNRQEIGGHGKVQLVDEGRHFGGRIQQVDDGAAQLVQFSLEGSEHSRSHVGSGGEASPPPGDINPSG